MRIVVSGAAGFIGSHLVDQLLEAGHEVVGVDNLATGSLRNIAHLKGQKRFTLIEQDVCEPLRIEGKVERIFHLASPASPVAYATQRVATMKVNSQGTWNLLDLAVAKGARFLVASTSEIYGDPLQSPQREEYWGNVNPIGLRSMYEEAKRFAEACTMAYHRERQADTRIVRIFNSYGPRMCLNDGRVVTNFVRQVLSNEPITVYGDGAQMRSICYVTDLVEGMMRAMEADFHEPINLGNPEDVSILNLAREILTLVPESRSTISYAQGEAYDPRLRKPEIARAKQLLGWTPKVSRREGLGKVVGYFKAMQSAK